MHRQVLCLLILLVVYPFNRTLSIINAYPFIIVIDPGHGGKDPGGLGSIVREKDVVLDVALRFGKLINKNDPEVKVIYTRSTDVFIPLEKRAQIANKGKANLFISIHSDWAESKTAHGASTFTLGQNRTRENFEIAKRENSVILLEENYQQRYEGFDPNSAESYIMFEFMQDNYMNQSIQFASILQNKFTYSGRNDRGVRQDVFLVLKNTSMPSTLVELGFLTNKEEEIFLKSDEGRNQMAASLYNGFKEFKDDYELKSGLKQASEHDSETINNTPMVAVSKKTEVEGSQEKVLTKNVQTIESYKEYKDKIVRTDSAILKNERGIAFKVQLILSPKPIPENDNSFKGLKMGYYIDKGNYKYTYGSWTNFIEADKMRQKLSSKFSDAFVVAFRNGQRIPLDEARKEMSK